MPSPVGHTLGAYSAWLLFYPDVLNDRRKNFIALGASLLFGTLADADFIVAQFTHNPVLQHHYFSHSIPFAFFFTLVCLAACAALKVSDAPKMGALLGTCYASHLLLDYFAGDGGAPFGIPLLWPFSHAHLLAPFALFYPIHRGDWHDLFSLHNLLAVFREIVILLPIVLLIFVAQKRRTLLR